MATSTELLRVVAVDDLRIEAQIPVYDWTTGELSNSRRAWAIRDRWGWALMRRLATDRQPLGEVLTVERIDGLPESMARRAVADRLLVLAST